MPKFGYTLYCEGNPPKDLVRQAVAAEEAGFDFLVISDHHHPWLTSQSHSGVCLERSGAVAQATERIELATMVTCPIMRYHRRSWPRWPRRSRCSPTSDSPSDWARTSG